MPLIHDPPIHDNDKRGAKHTNKGKLSVQGYPRESTRGLKGKSVTVRNHSRTF